MVLRADSGCYNRKVTEACRKAAVSFSITAKLYKGLHKLIASIEEADWAPIPYWSGDGADVAEAAYRPFSDSHPEVRLIVRRVKLGAITCFGPTVTRSQWGQLELTFPGQAHAGQPAGAV
jgi:hypothetical protein